MKLTVPKKRIGLGTIVILVLLAIAVFKDYAPILVLASLAVFGLYKLIRFLIPKWKERKAVKLLATNPQSQTAPKVDDQTPEPPQQAEPVPESAVVKEIPTEFKITFMRHVNYRITEKLQGAYPGATWSWCDMAPFDTVMEGGTCRIRTFNTGEKNFAEIDFEANGRITVSMIQVEVLAAAPSQPAKKATGEVDPDSIDLKEWYELLASPVIRATVDEVCTRGFKSLSIDEAGEVFVTENKQRIKQGKLDHMPTSKLWPDLVPFLADDDLGSTVQDGILNLTWGTN